ncbi:hypothetical protein RN88_07895 [Streptococcus intermedius]|nr:hypothetical protein RN88_07895 [Streptococcus intermedius]AVH83566.1 hypothetical protein A6J72_09670 [Streptococcus intermedius]
MTTKHLIFIMNQKIYSYNKNYVIFLQKSIDFFIFIVYNYNCKRNKENPLHSSKQDEIPRCAQLKEFHLYFGRDLKLCKLLTAFYKYKSKR